MGDMAEQWDGADFTNMVRSEFLAPKVIDYHCNGCGLNFVATDYHVYDIDEIKCPRCGDNLLKKFNLQELEVLVKQKTLDQIRYHIKELNRLMGENNDATARISRSRN